MKIGVTGVYASGKGTVCAMFRELGAHVLDTDTIAREIVEPGSDILLRLKEEVGTDIINKNGTLNRIKLADIVFKDKKKVSLLNRITHPPILQRVKDIIQSSSSQFFVVNIPLLYESGFDRYMDKNIVVTAHDDQIIERGIKRAGITENEIRNRLKNQISLKEKIKKADYIIDNSYTIENTRRQVIEIWNNLTKEGKRE